MRIEYKASVEINGNRIKDAGVLQEIDELLKKNNFSKVRGSPVPYHKWFKLLISETQDGNDITEVLNFILNKKEGGE